MAALVRNRFARRFASLASLLAPALALAMTGVCISALAQQSEGCRLNSANGAIQHIVHIQFDNVHFRRDVPNVPSDLEQMPNLLNFLEQNGTVLTNHHTPLISHTADDIITTLTGVYGDKHGQPVANSYGYFKANGSVGFSSSFAYWTDTAPDGKPQMIDRRGMTHPAPWVPFTRAGCDFGAFSTANIEFENVSSDINNVFGPTSWEAAEAAANFNKAVADFEGISVHCARHSAICGKAGAPDLLADEPGGYEGFNALFGNYFVAPRINHGQPSVNDLDGNPINDGNGNVGFPGFDPSASQTLGYVATMLEAGVPVVYAYIADAHDNHITFSGSFGPGEAGYVQQLASYNVAFGKFFARLQADGITKDNTLFIITSDENDHFAGQPGVPAGCDGIHTPCTYDRQPPGCDGDANPPCTSITPPLGEVNADLNALLLTEYPGSVPPAFSAHFDSAPTIYIHGQPASGASVTRGLELQMAALKGFDPIKGGVVPVMTAMGDVAEMKLLHMVTQDPARTPTFTLFGDPDFYLTAYSGETACASLAVGDCSNEQPGFIWNHGDFQEDITRTWLGVVGPGVRSLGVSDEPFSDHTDIRPTLLSLAGLKDDYAHDGRVLFEVLQNSALPSSVLQHRATLLRLADAYKAINAPLGALGRTSLKVSTSAIQSSDATYGAYVSRITSLTAQRDTIAASMIQMLENAAFNNQPIDETRAQNLIDSAQQLLQSIASD
ncbi:MAG TPA: hypothetical protein VH183_05685 [Burkholderiaceae bacterium]|nr:hypothetical protein [Burkholderiaceae bacterium]